MKGKPRKATKGSSGYHEYLLSERWRLKRVRVIWRDQARCAKCRSRDNLEVHHTTYAHFGNEPLADLITLCRECHKAVHRN